MLLSCKKDLENLVVSLNLKWNIEEKFNSIVILILCMIVYNFIE